LKPRRTWLSICDEGWLGEGEKMYKRREGHSIAVRSPLQRQ
jgi:hypothetical protein